MRKMRTLLCLALMLALMASVMLLASCESKDDPKESTQESDVATEANTQGETNAPETQAPATEAPTAAPTEPVTNAPSDPTTDAPDDETKAPNPADYPEDEYIVIQSVEDLLAFNKLVNGNNSLDPSEQPTYIEEMTVVFLADIDLEGVKWEPLDGNWLYNVTFDGMGHTIKHMTIDYNVNNDYEPHTPGAPGCGFIDVVYDGEFIFKDITFEDAYITACHAQVACLVGRSQGGSCSFENVTVKGFTVDGWCDYNNTDVNNDGHPIAFRVAGFMGGIWGGYHDFVNCTVQDIKISGFHNLAGFVGYDATNSISEFSFTDCKVENAEMIFSYCLADAYTVDMPRKFVSVFYNGAKWVDNIDACVEAGNTYSNVSFYDWTTDPMDEYTPEDFRSWTEEEAGA